MVFVLLLSLQSIAQEKGFVFQSAIQAGLLEGQRGSAFQLQAINGVSYKTWAAGIGAGLDYYHTRSIPVFVNLRKAFGTSQQTPFLYASGGYNIPWLKDEDKSWGFQEANGGLYYDAGIGYQLPVLKKSVLFFTAGYSQKRFSRQEMDGVAITIWPMPPPRTRLHEYSLQRLSIQTGLRF
jgi:hypothetical protein